ncbi:MAG: DUF3078 domain-containing protein [Polyangiaceae bacterium]|nr:DUF3078 domain-containing protein [Polyangiaceae bacterium]
MLSFRRVFASSLAFSSLVIATQASAQDVAANTVKKEATDVKVTEAPAIPNGVYASLRGDITLSFTDQQRVVGQIDGSTVNFGVKIDGKADVIHDEHEWRNSLLINAGLTKTPNIPEFIKNTDSLQFESIYLYHIKPWIGPFARFKLDTPMFAGTDVRPGATNYKVTSQDGTITQTCDPTIDAECKTTRFPLTDGFQPLTLRESIGVFAQPYKTNPITIEARVGFGAQEILADKQYAIADIADDATNCPARINETPGQKSAVPCVEVNQLSDVLQAGLEANLEVWGKVYDDKITYKAYAGILAPFAHGDLPQSYFDAGGQDDVGQLTNVDLGINVNFKIVEWASLTYELKAVRVPQLLPDTFQVRNTLMLTMGYGVDNKPPPAPAPAPAK